MKMRQPAVGALVLLAAACASRAPAPEALGDRLRIRIAGRGDEPSITTARHRVFVVLRGADGRLHGLHLHAPEWCESEFLTGLLAVRLEGMSGVARPSTAEALHGDPRLAHDVVLPPGCSLVFEPGSTLVCRRNENGRFVADAEPEIRIGQISADGSRYVEAPSGSGIDLGSDEDPPGWPPARR